MTKVQSGGTRIAAFVANPTARAVASKLVTDINKGRLTRQVAGGETMPGVDVLGRMSAGISRSITDANNILETLPDVELAMQIMVSGILSPSDLRSPKLTHIVGDTTLDSSLTADLLRVLQEHFTKFYKIEEWLPNGLEDALFKTGSYPLMIVPENSLDDIINNKTPALEAYFTKNVDSNGVLKPLGLLGPGLSAGPKRAKSKAQKHGFGLEGVFMGLPPGSDTINSKINMHITVTDNYAALKLPLVAQRLTQGRARASIWRGSTLAASLESAAPGLNLNHISDAIYHRRNFQSKEVVRIRPASQATRAPIGHPLIMKLPSESCIPVHVPSNPRDHLGYFILLDEFGHPLANAMESNYYQELNNAISQNNGVDEASKMLQQSRYFSSGLNCRTDQRTMRALSQAYSEMVEKDLMERLKNGYLGESVEISRPEEVYRIMFARSLAGRQTMLLYVPSELMTYIAFDHNQAGIGRSLLDKSKILAAIRATLMFANTMAAIKNSTARQNLTIELEETDPDPEGTVEYLVNEFVKLQSHSKIAATTNPLDIVDGIQRANVSVAVSGNPNYPETKVGVEDAQSQRAQIDNDFSKMISSQLWMSFGLAPEIIDDMQRIEFAASQITSNALMTKRFALYQSEYCRFISDHARKYVLNSGSLMGELIMVVRKHRKELKNSERVKSVDQVEAQLTVTDKPGEAEGEVYSVKENDPGAIQELQGSVFDIIGEFLDAYGVQLPPPDDTRIEAQAEAFAQFSDLLDKVLEVRLSDDVLSGVLGEVKVEHKDALKQAIKATYQRRWLIRNNVLMELEDLKVKEAGDEGETLVNEYVNYTNDIANNLAELFMKIKERNEQKDAANNVGGDGDETTSDLSTSSDLSGESTGGEDPEFDLSAEPGGDESLGGEPAGDEPDFDLDL